MPYTSLLVQYTSAQRDALRHGPLGPEACDRLYDFCAAGIAAEERFPGSTGANSRWWATELLCWLHCFSGDAVPRITPDEVR